MKKTYNEKEISCKLKDYIVAKRHYRELDLTREKVAEALCIPKAYISRVMKERFHCTFSDFVNKYRAYYAHRVLTSEFHNEKTLEEIALHCGFTCRMTFHRMYKKVYGITPGEERLHKNAKA